MSFDEVWGRVKKVTDLKKQTDLAIFLGIKHPSVTGAKKRDVFLTEWAFKIAQSYNLSTDWILTGEGPMKRVEEKGKISQQPSKECLTVDIVENTTFIRAVEMLARIYSSGNDTLITAIEHNLRAFSSTIEAKKLISVNGTVDTDERFMAMISDINKRLESIESQLQEHKEQNHKKGNVA